MNDWKRCFLGIPEGSPQTIGQLLRQMRKEAGYTQLELEVRVGLERSTIIKIEKDDPASIEALDAVVLRKWKNACKSKMHLSTIATYQRVVMKFFNLI